MRSVVITGASTGIGRISALRLDAAGWRVFAGVRREEDAQALREAGSERLVPVMLEITDAGQVGAAAELVAETVGEAGLQGLINNAAVTTFCPMEALPIDDFRRLLEVNLVSQVAVTQALLPQLRKGSGRLLFVSSISARRAVPLLGAYSASKSGLGAVADALRQELRQWGISVSLIEPGFIETPMWGRGEKEASATLGRSPIDATKLYGEMIVAFHELVERIGRHKTPAEKVAASIEHALVARRPRTRYVVGSEARFQAPLFRVMPDRALDFVTARLLRL